MPEKDPYEIQTLIERVSDDLIDLNATLAIVKIAEAFDVDLAEEFCA